MRWNLTPLWQSNYSNTKHIPSDNIIKKRAFESSFFCNNLLTLQSVYGICCVCYRKLFPNAWYGCIIVFFSDHELEMHVEKAFFRNLEMDNFV